MWTMCSGLPAMLVWSPRSSRSLPRPRQWPRRAANRRAASRTSNGAQGTAANDVAHVGIDAFVNVSGVVGSDYDDILSGTDNAAHVDVFYGGKGADMINGRDGYDFVSYYSFFDPSVITGGISVNLAVGTVTGD